MAEHRQAISGSGLIAYLRRMAASLVAMYLAGVANAAQDIAANKAWYNLSIFPQAGESASEFWGPKDHTWVNKWNVSESGAPLVGVERFFLSSSALVWLTDIWHAAQTVMLTAIQISVLLYRRPPRRWMYLADLAALKLAFSAGWWTGRIILM